LRVGSVSAAEDDAKVDVASAFGDDDNETLLDAKRVKGLIRLSLPTGAFALSFSTASTGVAIVTLLKGGKGKAVLAADKGYNGKGDFTTGVCMCVGRSEDKAGVIALRSAASKGELDGRADSNTRLSLRLSAFGPAMLLE